MAGAPLPRRWGYVSQPRAYNNLHLRTYQLVVPSLLGVVLYRLRFYLASAALLLLTAATLPLPAATEHYVHGCSYSLAQA